MIHLPAIVLPAELVGLLKDPGAASTGLESPFNKTLRKAPAMALILERAFSEFNEHKVGLEKIFVTLGWAHFRDRMTSVYLFKGIYGSFPDKTDMDLVDGIKKFELRFQDSGITGQSRLFLLGVYLRFYQIYLSQREEGGGAEVDVPASVSQILSMPKVRSDRPDWIILLAWHFDSYLQTDAFIDALKAGATYQTLFAQLTRTQQQQMISNLLSYGASIQESDPFLFERI